MSLFGTYQCLLKGAAVLYVKLPYIPVAFMLLVHGTSLDNIRQIGCLQWIDGQEGEKENHILMIALFFTYQLLHLMIIGQGQFKALLNVYNFQKDNFLKRNLSSDTCFA